MGTSYTIKPGDNLSTIAKRYGTTASELQKLNSIVNPNLIYAGSTILLPPTISPSLTNAITGSNDTSNGFKESDATTALGDKKSAAEDAVTNRGEYSWIGDEKLNDYISQWESRPDFSYDFNADALYQQYKDKYIKQGKMAMADTIGQASAMTGGYGNSYAQSVGQQTYQGYLEQLNDVVPELYQMAYDRYNQEGQDLLSTIGLLRGERDFDYGTWADKTDRLIADRGYYGDEYDRSYGKDYTIHRDAVTDKKWQDEFDLALKQYEDSKFVSGGGGYKSTIDEDGKPVVTPVVEESASVPASVIKALGNYTTLQGQADYLAKTGLDEEVVFDLLDKYGVVPLTDRSWEVVDDGGVNWFWGVDNNAVVRDENGTEYTLKELKKELEKTMSSADAKDYIKKLQKQLGI